MQLGNSFVSEPVTAERCVFAAGAEAVSCSVGLASLERLERLKRVCGQVQNANWRTVSEAETDCHQGLAGEAQHMGFIGPVRAGKYPESGTELDYSVQVIAYSSMVSM